MKDGILSPAIFIAICVAVAEVAAAICPGLAKNPTVLKKANGRITYSSSSNEAECVWKIPPIPSAHHAIQVILKDARLKQRGSHKCGGAIFLPGAAKICEASQLCRTYVLMNSTCRVSDVVARSIPECSKSIIYMDKLPRKDVRYVAQNTGGKTMYFTLQYKTINCNSAITTQTASRAMKTEASETMASQTELQNTIALSNGSNSTDAFGKPEGAEPDGLSSTMAAIIAIIVILVLLLIATCVMLVQMYKRKQKAVTFQNPAVVAYVHENFHDDSSSLCQVSSSNNAPSVEYINFPRNEVAAVSTESLSMGIYAEIGSRNSVSPQRQENTARAYENVPLETQNKAKSTENLVVLNTSTSPDSVYAKVNKVKTMPKPET